MTHAKSLVTYILLYFCHIMPVKNDDLIKFMELFQVPGKLITSSIFLIEINFERNSQPHNFFLSVFDCLFIYLFKGLCTIKLFFIILYFFK